MNKLNFLLSKLLVTIVLFAICFLGFDHANSALRNANESSAITGSLVCFISGMLVLLLIAHLTDPSFCNDNPEARHG